MVKCCLEDFRYLRCYTGCNAHEIYDAIQQSERIVDKLSQDYNSVLNDKSRKSAIMNQSETILKQKSTATIFCGHFIDPITMAIIKISKRLKEGA